MKHSGPLPQAKLLDALQKLAPLEFAEPWDNVGLLVDNDARPVERVLLCIDYTEVVAAAAVVAQVDFVVAYHPCIFKPLRRLRGATPIATALRHRQAIYSPHTAWDAVADGSSDHLLRGVGAATLRPLRPHAADSSCGVGRLGSLAAPTLLAELAARLKTSCQVTALLQVDGSAAPIDRVAACPGAGGELLPEVLQSGAQLFVTGELSHHHALALQAAGINALCTLHSHSERPSLQAMQRALQAACPTVSVDCAAADDDPFHII